MKEAVATGQLLERSEELAAYNRSSSRSDIESRSTPPTRSSA
jgi:hypothetical protein